MTTDVCPACVRNERHDWQVTDRYIDCCNLVVTKICKKCHVLCRSHYTTSQPDLPDVSYEYPVLS